MANTEMTRIKREILSRNSIDFYFNSNSNIYDYARLTGENNGLHLEILNGDDFCKIEGLTCLTMLEPSEESSDTGFPTCYFITGGYSVYKVFQVDVRIPEMKSSYRECGSYSSFKDARSIIPEGYSARYNVASDSIIGLAGDQVFVFGSDPAGGHKGGAANQALKNFGAQIGVGEGMAGQSYAIPTIKGDVKGIKKSIDRYISFAKEYDGIFLTTRVGCGTAGFKDSTMAQLFRGALGCDNIFLPLSWICELDRPNLFTIDEYPEIDVCGRSTTDEWLANLSILCAVNQAVKLSFADSHIEIVGEATPLVDDLIKRINGHNSRRLITKLSALYDYASGLETSKLWNYFHHSVLMFYDNCCDLDDSTNLPRRLVEFSEYLLKDKNCNKVYVPYSGCGVYAYYGLHIVNQEPSTALSLISRIKASLYDSRDEDCIEGSFEHDWIGDECDGLFCVLPYEYGNSKHKKAWDGKTDNSFRMISIFFDKIIQSNSLKYAVVVIPEMFLYNPTFLNVRRVLLENGIIDRVMDPPCDVYSGARILCLDWQTRHDYVRFPAMENYWGILESHTEEYALEDEDSSLEFYYMAEIEQYDLENFVPVNDILDNQCFLISEVYNEPIPIDYEDDDNYAIITGEERMTEDDYEFIPLGNLLTRIKPVVVDGVELVSDPSYSFKLSDVIKGQASLVKVGMFGNVNEYSGRFISITEKGLFYHQNEGGILLGGYQKDVYRPDTSKIDIEYLLMCLCSVPFERMLGISAKLRLGRDQISKWKIPVPKGGLEQQRHIVQETLSSGPAISDAKYAILLQGVNLPQNLDLERFNIETIKEDIGDLVMSKVLNAIVVSSDYKYDDGNFTGVEDALRLREKYDVNIFIIVKKGHNREDIIDYCSGGHRKYLRGKNCFFDVFDESMILQLRSELDFEASPEAIVMKKYKDAFDDARYIDKCWNFGCESFLKRVLVSAEYSRADIPEGTIKDLRTHRDYLLKKLRECGLTPSGLGDPGAITSFLSNHQFGFPKNKELVYFQIKDVMPQALAEGLDYMTRVCNHEVHERTEVFEPSLALSLVNLYIVFLAWIKKNYQLLSTPHSEGEFWTKVDFSSKSWKNNVSVEGVLQRCSRVGDDYFYVNEIHITPSNNVNESKEPLKTGRRVRILRYKEEGRPFFTGTQNVYFFAEEWEYID